MKKALAIVLAVVLLIVCACNTNKAAIKSVSIDNIEYNKERNFLSFDVSVNPNKFDELKVYFISKDNYDSNNYGDYYRLYENSLEEGKFTLSLEGKEKIEYVLFAYVKSVDQKEYLSDCINVDLTGEEALINGCASN